MPPDLDVLVTLSAFASASDEPLRLLRGSGLRFDVNRSGRRMTSEEVLASGRNARGLLAGVEPYPAEVLRQFPRLRVISRCGAGTDSIDMEEARRHGIRVLNTPDEPVQAVAELALAMMLALLRDLPRVDRLMHARRWERVEGRLLAGKTVGIVGLGRIGRAVAALVQAFDAKVIATDPQGGAPASAPPGIRLRSLRGLLGEADIVTLHASRDPAAPVRFGRPEFALMRRGAYLLNLARGDMVDDVALREALDSGHLAGAGLDVYSTEPYTGTLCESDRVLLSPHQATLTRETRAAMELRAVENLLHGLQAGR